MRVLIVAKTRMGGGACIGALTETGESVRLVPFNADPRDGANREYEVGDIWEITSEPVAEDSLIPPHIEDIVVLKKSHVYTTRNLKELESSIQLLMPPKVGDPRKLYEDLLQTTDSGSLYVPYGGDVPPYSTTFWRTDKSLKLETDKKKLRYRYPSEDSGCTLTFVGYQKPLEVIPADTLLRVSLAHWWHPKDRSNAKLRCYVQLSGWFLEEEGIVGLEPPLENREPPLQTNTSSLEILKNIFGHEQFLTFQEEIIKQIRNGQDSLVVLPTGGGKSLCYQLPACVFNGLTVVVSPLIALMQDQVMQLKQKGIRAAFLNHMVVEEDYIATMNEVRKGEIKLLYIAPETLVQRPEIHVMLYETDVACFAIDEAHCISQWGHDFRPNYRELHWVREQFPKAVCIALTATATPKVQADIKQSLNIPVNNQFIDSFNRENLLISVERRYELLGQTLAFLKKHTDESGIIYCQRRKHVDWLCENLVVHGISAIPYHAGLAPDIRKQNQDAFIYGDTRVIVATIAFGMGIDKADVRFVLHAWLPKNPESYYQEIGRAGRDGESAECLLLLSHNDEDTIKDFIDDGDPSQREGQVESFHKLIEWTSTTECRRKKLLTYFGENYEIQNCGMCDNCNNAKVGRVDLTEPVQKLLSCIVRVEESNTNVSFGDDCYIGTLQRDNRCVPICLPAGVLYIVDILCGEMSEKISTNEHDKLSTWRIGEKYRKEQWYYLALQLLQNDYFQSDTEDGNLHLTDKGRETNKKNLKPEARFMGLPMNFVTCDSGTGLTVNLNTYETAFPKQDDYDPVLYGKLRDKRRKVAEVEKIKASMVVPLDSLKEMTIKLPQTEDTFTQIRGIGKVRMKYVDDFLPIICNYCKDYGIDSVEGKTEKENANDSISIENREYSPDLFDQLQQERKIVAGKEGVPAYVVFNDKTLKEMATCLPRTEEAFLRVRGVGSKKLEKYADIFLSIIRAYCKGNGLKSVENVPETLNTNEIISKEQSSYSQELFELLQDKRKIIADEEGVSAFVVFWNKTLEEMATYLPQTEEEFKQIFRVSPEKAIKYADDFLPIIREYCKEHRID